LADRVWAMAPSLPSSGQAFRTAADAKQRARRIVSDACEEGRARHGGHLGRRGSEQANNEMAAKLAAEAGSGTSNFFERGQDAH